MVSSVAKAIWNLGRIGTLDQAEALIAAAKAKASDIGYEVQPGQVGVDLLAHPQPAGA
jgi:hypothetical protein